MVSAGQGEGKAGYSVGAGLLEAGPKRGWRWPATEARREPGEVAAKQGEEDTASWRIPANLSCHLLYHPHRYDGACEWSPCACCILAVALRRLKHPNNVETVHHCFSRAPFSPPRPIRHCVDPVVFFFAAMRYLCAEFSTSGVVIPWDEELRFSDAPLTLLRCDAPPRSREPSSRKKTHSHAHTVRTLVSALAEDREAGFRSLGITCSTASMS
jgi:hypothetical protein